MRPVQAHARPVPLDAAAAQFTPKRDAGLILDGIRTGLHAWESFLVPLVRDAQELYRMARDGELQRAVQRAVQKALKRELAKTSEELATCLELAAWTSASMHREQNISLALDFSGVPAGGDLRLQDVQINASMLDELQASNMTALACYQVRRARRGCSVYRVSPRPPRPRPPPRPPPQPPPKPPPWPPPTSRTSASRLVG